MPTAVLWFRRDLRLHDHPALLAARDAAGPDGTVLPVFVFDDRLWGPAGGPRRRFLLDCLAELREATDGALVHRARATRPRVVSRLVAEVGADSVHVSADAGPYGRRRDAAVERALDGVPLVRTGSPYASRRPRHQGATAPRTRCSHRSPAPGGSTAGGRRPSAPARSRGTPASGRRSLRPPPPPTAPACPPPGEAAARAAWRRFLAERLAGYAEGRDRPRPTGPAGCRPT